MKRHNPVSKQAQKSTPFNFNFLILVWHLTIPVQFPRVCKKVILRLKKKLLSARLFRRKRSNEEKNETTNFK